MKIVVEFNSLEEMDQFCNGIAVAPRLAGKVNAVQETEATEDKPKAEKKKGKAAKEEPAQVEPEADAEVQEEPAAQEEDAVQEYTLEDVRAKLGALQKAGHKDEVKAMLKSVGAEKLPEVDPKDYAVLMQKAGELDA